MDLWLHCQGSA